MKTIYDVGNEDALATQGYKPYKDTTLKSMSKDDLIDQIRCLEHNLSKENVSATIRGVNKTCSGWKFYEKV